MSKATYLDVLDGALCAGTQLTSIVKIIGFQFVLISAKDNTLNSLTIHKEFLKETRDNSEKQLMEQLVYLPH